VDVELLHRIQFAATISFHFIFPPMSMGVGLVLMIFGIQSVRTNDPKWRQLSLFWTKLYGLIFSMGVATGIVQEFQFGTNWSVYSRFVGNIFGALLAAEGIFAFMLEGGFLGLMLFGGYRLGNRLWLFATSMVVLGAHFSALWIIMANSWMQSPRGFELRDDRFGTQAIMTSFAETVFTPTFGPRIWHTWTASWMVGAALVLSVAAYYLLKDIYVEQAKAMMRIALPIFTVFAVLQLALLGRASAESVAEHQAVKLAAMEGLFDTTSCAPMTVLGWVDTASQTVTGIQIPCLLSILVGGSTDTVVQGLNDFPQEDWPIVNLVFQTYHTMINLAMLFVAVGLLACLLWWRGRLWTTPWMLRVLVGIIVLTHVSTIAGWWTAEFGRQPWIVWELLRTEDAFSPNVTRLQVTISLVLFVALYSVLLVVFLWLLDKHIKKGPYAVPDVEHTDSLPDTFAEIFRSKNRQPRASIDVEAVDLVGVGRSGTPDAGTEGSR
jgi:cytochrome d ubiquinol oxidase subunit I